MGKLGNYMATILGRITDLVVPTASLSQADIPNNPWLRAGSSGDDIQWKLHFTKPQIPGRTKFERFSCALRYIIFGEDNTLSLTPHRDTGGLMA